MSRAEGEIVIPGGAFDMHVHLRDPGATDAEDFRHGTQAALAGGATQVADMVNNPGYFTNSIERLEEKEQRAQGNIYADLARHYRYQPGENNVGTFQRAVHYAFGLKSMLDISTGHDEPELPEAFREGWEVWHGLAMPTQPIILHAEKDTIQDALAIAAGDIGHPTHVAHISNRAELETVMWAKRRGWPVTGGWTLHHAFMDIYDEQDWYQRMKPKLAEPQDTEFMWRHKEEIDVFETDHAPHTRAKKEEANAANPIGDEQHPVKCYGVPGLEALAPLVVSAWAAGDRQGSRFMGKYLEPEEIINKLAIRPRQILGVPLDRRSSTKLRIIDHVFGSEDIRSKCGWSPYTGWLMHAQVVQVDIRGTTVYRDGEFFGGARGRVLLPAQSESEGLA